VLLRIKKPGYLILTLGLLGGWYAVKKAIRVINYHIWRHILPMLLWGFVVLGKVGVLALAESGNHIQHELLVSSVLTHVAKELSVRKLLVLWHLLKTMLEDLNKLTLDHAHRWRVSTLAHIVVITGDPRHIHNTIPDVQEKLICGKPALKGREPVVVPFACIVQALLGANHL